MKFFTVAKISENIRETPEGYLICLNVPIARTGEMVYGPDETPIEPGENDEVLISRDENEVFRPETLASFEGKPITITHPIDFVTPDNWARLAKGTIQNVRRGEGDEKDSMIADLLVTDKQAIALIHNGLREVSCGYEASYVELGEGKGKQKHIVGNHLALVDQGRAGSSYAIHDHKRKGSKAMKLNEKIKAIFAKAQDEAMKLGDEDAGEKGDEPAKDAVSYDELVKCVKDLSDKIQSMGKPKDEGQGERDMPPDGKKDEPAKDDEDMPADDADASMEDRMKAMEAAVAKILEKISAKAGDEDEEMDDDDDDTGVMSDDSGEELYAADDEGMGGELVGDASRIEILAPGLKAKGKDAKVQALKACYATKDGKAAIHLLTGDKAPKFDDAAKVDLLFNGAAELLKGSRQSEFSQTKRHTVVDDAQSKAPQVMTAEKMNELNAKHYSRNN